MERKHKHWLLASVGVLLGLVIAVILILRSESFHNYVLRKIIDAAASATGGRVEIASYEFHIAPLHVDLYNVVVHGTEQATEKPLLRVDHLRVTLKIISAIRRKFDVNEIIIDQPSINFRVDARGHSNLPVTPKSNSSGNTNLFDMAINHLQLNRGELVYNDQQKSLSADVHNLTSKIAFDSSKREYSGTLVYSAGHVRFGTASAVEHNLDSALTVAENWASLDRFNVASGSSVISMHGKVQNFSQPVLDAQYQISVSTVDVDRLMHDATLRDGQIASQGSVHYQAVPHKTFLESVLLQGTLQSTRLGIYSTQFRTNLQDIHSHYTLRDGNVSAPDFHVGLLGGSLTAALEALHIAEVPEVHLTGAIHSLSLENASSIALKSATAPPLKGRADGTFEAGWRQSVKNLQARVDVSLVATTSSTNGSQNAIPVNGKLHARYDAPRALLSLQQSYLRTNATILRFDGTIGNQASLAIQANSSDLHELDMLALAFRPPSPGQQPASFGLYGSGQFQGQVTGTTKEPHLAGQLSAANLQVKQSKWRSLRTSIDVTPRSATLKNGELISANNGRITFDASTELRNWSYVPSNQMNVRLQVSGIQAEELERFANLHYPISGVVSGNATLNGTQLEPHGQGSIQLSNGKMWDQPVQTFAVNFQGTGQSISTRLTLKATSVSANGNLNYSPRTEAYELSLDARADNLSSIEALKARNIQSQGAVTLSAHGRGTIKDPELQASFDVPQLTAGGSTVSGIKAQLQLAQHRGNFDLSSTVSNASVKAHGTVDLKANYPANVTLDTKSFPLNPILNTYFPDNPDLGGQIDLHVNLVGPLKEPARIEGHLEIPNLKINYKDIEISNAGAIRADYRNGTVQLAHSELKGNNTDLQFEGTVPVRSPAPMNVAIRGNADLSLVKLIDKQSDSSGRVTLNLTARGSMKQPDLGGNIRLENAAYSTPTSPLGVENVNGQITIANNRFEVTQLTGQSGGGNFTMHGYMLYNAKPTFNLGLDAHTIRLRYPEGLRALFDGQLALNGSTDTATLNGNVSIQRLSFTKDFDMATFVTQFADSTSSAPATGFANNIQLNVGIQSGGNLGLQSTKVSLQGDANLRVIGTAANPVITGRANITEGELFFLDNRYKIERAVLEFANPVRTEPVINLLATTKINNFDISINMVGPMERLRTNYISDPALPPVDIINLITRGTTTEAAAPANLGANSLIAKGLASQVSSRVGKLAGISSLQIDPLIGGGNRNPSARVAIQERITKDIIFTYAADLTSTQNELIQVEYQITPVWSMRVLRDENGSFSIEGRMRKNF